MEQYSPVQPQPQTTLHKPGALEMSGAAFIITGILVFLAIFSHQSSMDGGNWIGTLGHYSASFLLFLFGHASYVVGPYLIVIGGQSIYKGELLDPLPRLIALCVLLISLSLGLHLFVGDMDGRFWESGGVVGRRLGELMLFLFGTYGSYIIAIGSMIAGIILFLRLPVPLLVEGIEKSLKIDMTSEEKMKNSLQKALHQILKLYGQLTRPGEVWEGPLPTEKSSNANQGEAVAQSGESTDSEQSLPEAAAVGSATAAGRRMHRRPWLERVELFDEEARPVVATSLRTIEKRLGEKGERLQSIEERSRRVEHEPRGHHSDAAQARMEEVAIRLKSGLMQMRTAHHKPDRPLEHSVDAAWNLSASADRLQQILERQKSSRPSPISAPAYSTRSRPTTSPAFHGYFVAGESRFQFLHSKDQLPDVEELERDTTINRGDDAELVHPLLRPLNLQIFDADSLIRLRTEQTIYQPEAKPDLEPELELELEAGAEGEPFVEPTPLHVESYAELDALPFEAPPLPPAAAASTSTKAPAPFSPHDESEIGRVRLRGRYRLSPEILNLPPEGSRVDHSAEIDATRVRLEEVMRDYGIQARVVATTRGPIITLYEIKLEPGVRVSRIQGISDEIRMHLAAASVRIVAPIPGKSTVGIEIPNHSRDSVVLGEIVRRDRRFFSAERELSIPLGKDIAGENLYVDLTKLPHLLVAGATGAGKSVYMNTTIASLLYNRSPEELRLLMIDPKMVELKLYEGIPHLLMPVITDARKASRALSWLIQEMEGRYLSLSRLKCRDIRSYNERYAAELGRMPYVVVVIDELADLMMVSAKEVEDSIIRLTQKARAVGIHLIMATQRPSVDVITALIKANCPARISFHVAQKTDSRTILDSNGAESLLGRGDMLYRSPVSTGLLRIQAALITEEEIEKIVNATRQFGEPNYVELAGAAGDESGDESSTVDEELLEAAWQVIQESGKTSTSYVQRRLRIGYNRAANLIEQLEERGYLSEAIGNRPREILKRS